MKKIYAFRQMGLFDQDYKSHPLGTTVREAAALALGKIGDPRAIEPLIFVLNDSGYLRYIAIEILGDIGDDRALESLKSLKRSDIILPEYKDLTDISIEKIVERMGKLNSFKAGETWDMDNGWKIVVQAIYPSDEPKKVWLELYKDGMRKDYRFLEEGETYYYNNIYITKIIEISIGSGGNIVKLADNYITS